MRIAYLSLGVARLGCVPERETFFFFFPHPLREEESILGGRARENREL